MESTLFPMDQVTLGDRKNYTDRLTDLKGIYGKVIKNLLKAYRVNALRYNVGRKAVAFKEADLVWRRNFSKSTDRYATDFFSAKLAPKFIKSKIVKKISTNVYLLEDLEGKSRGHFHVKDIVKI